MEMSLVLEKELRLFHEKTGKSQLLFDEAKKYVPLGVHSNYRYTEPHPIYMKRGKGSKIWDVDGNQYIDYNMAFGALGIGHSHSRLVEVIRNRIENGTIFGFEPEEMSELVKIKTSRFGMDKVRLSNTGTEATMHAIRIARAHTARSKILKFEGCYHGAHDYVLVNVHPKKAKAGHAKFPRRVPSGPGIPKETTENTIVSQYNDSESVSA